MRFHAPSGASPNKKTDCSTSGGLLELSRAGHSFRDWGAVLPSLETWLDKNSSGKLHEEFQESLDQIGRLEAGGCISARERMAIEQVARESVPAAVHETMYFRYDDEGGGGFIDLEPGMRLKVERAHFAPSGKFQGTSTVYYQIVLDSHGAIGFRLTEASATSSASPNLQDRALDGRGAAYERLFFLGKLVPPNLNYSAMVVGTRSRDRLEAITREFQTRAERGCPSGAEGEVECTLFQGSVTVSAELRVTINKRPVFVGPGTTLRSLLLQAKQRGCENNIRSLRIEREFLNRPIQVEFDSVGASIFDLVVVDGDRISCTPARR